MNAGDTLIVPRKTPGIDGHLWVVISDPQLDPDSVLMVSLTSYEPYKDQTCELSANDHPFVSHRTLICYNPAKVASDEDLEKLVSSGLMRKHDPFSPELLKRVRQGAWDTDDIQLEHRQILIDQNLI